MLQIGQQVLQKFCAAALRKLANIKHYLLCLHCPCVCLKPDDIDVLCYLAAAIKLPMQQNLNDFIVRLRNIIRFVR